MKLLEIYLSPIDAQRFSAITTRSLAGDGNAESVLPFWQGKHDHRSTLIKTLELSGGFNRKAFPDLEEQAWMVEAGLLTSDCKGFAPDYLKRVGQALWSSLFPDGSSLRSCLDSALRLTEQAGEELHLRLKFAADSAKRSRLADYPWELLHDGQRFLLQSGMVLSRYIAYEALPPRISQTSQLKVLLVSSRAEDKRLKLPKLPENDQQAIREGLAMSVTAGSVVLETLKVPTLKGLSVYLTECGDQMPQVIHFDGHGAYGQRCGNLDCLRMHPGTKSERCSNCGQRLPMPEGFLLFEDGQGEPDYVSSVDFGLRLPKGVALVVLSACQSGMSVVGESVFSGLAQRLINARVSAVVAMQYSVRVDAASQFSEQFYRVLGQREPITVAMREGRGWMRSHSNQWYRPVLYLRWQDNDGGQLFEFEQSEEQEPKLSVRQRLERDRFTQELADLENQYAAVQSALRVETNPATMEKLKIQLEQLGEKMDVCERRLSREGNG